MIGQMAGPTFCFLPELTRNTCSFDPSDQDKNCISTGSTSGLQITSGLLRLVRFNSQLCKLWNSLLRLEAGRRLGEDWLANPVFSSTLA